MATKPFKSAAAGEPLYYPDAVISVPQRHVGITQGATNEHIMAIRLERSASVGIAMTATTPKDLEWVGPRDHHPRVLVAQIDTLNPEAAIQTCLQLFGTRASEDRKVYVVHDGSDRGLLDNVIARFKKTNFTVFRSHGVTNDKAINLDTALPFTMAATAPLYMPNVFSRTMIDACIAGQTYMSGPLEVLFDFSHDGSSKTLLRDFKLKQELARVPGETLQYAN